MLVLHEHIQALQGTNKQNSPILWEVMFVFEKKLQDTSVYSPVYELHSRTYM